MKASSLIGSCAIAALLTVTATTASAKSPCGTELCLSGMMGGSNPSECKDHIEDFFGIIKYKNGKPSGSRTLKARRSYLDQCQSGNDDDKKRILAKYGMVFM